MTGVPEDTVCVSTPMFTRTLSRWESAETIGLETASSIDLLFVSLGEKFLEDVSFDASFVQ